MLYCRRGCPQQDDDWTAGWRERERMATVSGRGEVGAPGGRGGGRGGRYLRAPPSGPPETQERFAACLIFVLLTRGRGPSDRYLNFGCA